MEILCKWILGDFQIFVASGQEKHAASIGTICFFIEYPENAKHNKNCISQSSHKIMGKLACLGVKMASLDQKHKTLL